MNCGGIAGWSVCLYVVKTHLVATAIVHSVHRFIALSTATGRRLSPDDDDSMVPSLSCQESCLTVVRRLPIFDRFIASRKGTGLMLTDSQKVSESPTKKRFFCLAITTKS